MKYAEAHLTLDPVFGRRRSELADLLKPFGFKLADLFMKKRKRDRARRSRFDSFATARGRSVTAMSEGIAGAMAALEGAGFIVRRAKIEAVLVDWRAVR